MPPACWPRSVWLERKTAAGHSRIVEGDPRKAQGFTPVNKDVRFLPGDTVSATCDFDSTSRKVSGARATYLAVAQQPYIRLKLELTPHRAAVYDDPSRRVAPVPGPTSLHSMGAGCIRVKFLVCLSLCGAL